MSYSVVVHSGCFFGVLTYAHGLTNLFSNSFVCATAIGGGGDGGGGRRRSSRSSSGGSSTVVAVVVLVFHSVLMLLTLFSVA